MFVQSEKFVEAHGGRRTDVSIFGQESNPTTWRLAHMNLAIHGIEAKLGDAPRGGRGEVARAWVWHAPVLKRPLSSAGADLVASSTVAWCC